MSRRPPTAHELAATIVFHDRYAAQRNGAIEFWGTLTAAEQDLLVHLVRAISEAQARPDPLRPRCPKRCDVSIRPEYIAAGRWVCYGCGTEFTWPPVLEVDDDPPPAAPPPPKDNVAYFPVPA